MSTQISIVSLHDVLKKRGNLAIPGKEMARNPDSRKSKFRCIIVES